MNFWTIVGYALLVISPLAFLSRLMSFNLLLWIYGALAFVFGMFWGVVILALSGSAQPTAQEISWYVYGVAGLGALMIASRFCTFLLRCFSPPKAKVFSVQDANGNQVGSVELQWPE